VDAARLKVKIFPLILRFEKQKVKCHIDCLFLISDPLSRFYLFQLKNFKNNNGNRENASPIGGFDVQGISR
jgi:hypothetical protein